jgi:sigma-B regulation protein RsbU (phosphoserine phosphatase)
MSPVDLIAFAIAFAIAVIICAAGLTAIAGYFLQRDHRERLLLWFGLFAAVYGVRMFFKQPLAGALSIPKAPSLWVEAAFNYLILIPALLFGRELYGPGWRGLFRWTIVGTGIYAIVAIVVDGLAGAADAAPDPSLEVLVATMFVIIAGARAGYRPPPFPEWRVLVTAIVVFLLFVVNEHAVGAGWVPWSLSVEPIGFLIQLSCLGYIAVARYFTQGRQLAAVDQEMRSAQEIQTSILPRELPVMPGVKLAARYLPLANVAGDFYDVVTLDAHTVAVLVADVSGHGVPAALIASMVKVAFASALHDTRDPGAVLTRMNATLSGMFARSYVTAACGVIDTRDRVLHYALAGHPPPLLVDRTRGTSIALDERGIVLGFTASATFTTTSVPLATEARLVLYTDGVTETPADDDFFGFERLAALTLAERATLPEVFADRVVRSLREFARSADPSSNGGFDHDDVTLAVVDIAILDAS